MSNSLEILAMIDILRVPLGNLGSRVPAWRSQKQGIDANPAYLDDAIKGTGIA